MTRKITVLCLFIMIAVSFNLFSAEQPNPVKLVEIIESNNPELIEKYISVNENPDDFSFLVSGPTDELKRIPALEYAFLNRKYASAAVMIDHSIGNNEKFVTFSGKETPLSYILRGDDQETALVFMLIEHGAELNFKPEENELPLVLQLENKIGKNDDITELFPHAYQNAVKKDMMLSGKFKALLDEDDASAFRKEMSANEMIRIGVTDENGEKSSLQSVDYSVRAGAIKCFRYLYSFPENRNPLIHARNAIKFNRLNILKTVIADVGQDDFMWILQDAYTNGNDEALKIILPHLKEIEKVHMFNGQSVFDYAWGSRNISMVMDTIDAYNVRESVKKQFRFILKNDIDKIKTNINGLNIGQMKINDDCTLVHLAAFLGREEILAYLLSLYEDVSDDEYGYIGSQAVYLAVIMKNEICFRLLADHEKKLSIYSPVYFSKTEPLSLADHVYINLGQDAAKYLYGKNIDNKIELSGYGLYSHDLNIAIKNGDMSYVEYLMNEYEPGYAKCSFSLETAVEYGRIDIIEFFISKGYDFSNYASLIQAAMKKDDVEMYKFLLKINPGYDRKMDSFYAVQNNSKAVLAEIIKTPKTVNYPVKKDRNYEIYDDTSLLIVAAERGALASAEVLIDKGADLNKVNSKGKTALLIAAVNQDILMTELLLNHGADVNVRFYEKDLRPCYYPPYFGIDRVHGKIFSVIDFNLSYSIYLQLRKAGAHFAWER